MRTAPEILRGRPYLSRQSAACRPPSFCCWLPGYLLSGCVTLAEAFMFSAPTIQAYCSSFSMKA